MDLLAHQTTFDRVAADYRVSRFAYPEPLIDWLAEQLGDTGPVVDVGCGPGTLLAPLSRRFARAIGLDFSAAMLREMRCACDLPSIQGVGEHLPLGTGSISLVVCSQSLHWMQVDLVLEEVKRVLRPAGRLLLCWQGWLSDLAPEESLFREGWQAVLGGSPRREPNRPRMHEVSDRLAPACTARFETPLPAVLTPEELAVFFASRASVGRVTREERDVLLRWWAEAARARFGPSLTYRFTIHGRLFRIT